MAQRFYSPIPRELTNAGAVGAGWKLYFYTTGTSTPITTYSNVGLSVANTNPVVADANGRFAEIFVNDFSVVKAVLKDSSDNTIWTVDPVNPSGAGSITLNDLGVRPTSYWGVTTGTASAYTLTANPTISAYSSNQTLIFQAHTACNASPTINIDGLGAINLKKYTGQGTKAALLAGDLQATERYEAINDGVDLVVLNPRTSINYAGTATAITIASGVATLTNVSNSYIIDGEGAAADTLDTINGLADGQEVTIQIANAARPITFSLSGNLLFPTGESMIVNSTTEKLRFVYRSSDAKAILIGTTRLYAPANQTITYLGTLTLAHGLGKTPDVIRTSLVNLSTEGGYTAGQNYLYALGPTDASASKGIAMLVDATNITIRFGSAIDLITSDGTTLFAASASNWALQIRAYLFT